MPRREHEAQATLFLLSKSSIFWGNPWFFEDLLNKNSVACASCSRWSTEKLIVSHESTSQMMENLSYQAKSMRLTFKRSPLVYIMGQNWKFGYLWPILAYRYAITSNTAGSGEDLFWCISRPDYAPIITTNGAWYVAGMGYIMGQNWKFCYFWPISAN